MPTHEPVLIVLAASALAAAMASLGALPFAAGGAPRERWIGAAYAFASGLMLGAGYLLLHRALEQAPVAVIGGAVGGVALTYLVQVYTGTAKLENAPGEDVGGDEVQVILQNTLHAAAEGVAIGVAMVLHLRLGLFMALALAVHNVAEATALTAILRRRGRTVGEAAGLAVVTKTSQPLFALAVFALHPVLGPLLPAALGFAAGSLFFLVLTELLPASYQRSSHTVSAFLVSFAAGALVMLEDFFV